MSFELIRYLEERLIKKRGENGRDKEKDEGGQRSTCQASERPIVLQGTATRLVSESLNGDMEGICVKRKFNPAYYIHIQSEDLIL